MRIGRAAIWQPNEAGAKLGKAESEYVEERAGKSIPLWEEYLNRVNLEDFEVKEFLCKAKKNGGKAGETLPNLGFSLSGGGARALSVTASILDAFDSRNEKAKEAKVGGILQLANYAAGVSGSSWLLGSWATSNSLYSGCMGCPPESALHKRPAARRSPDRQSSTLVFDKANLGIQGEERAFRSGNSYKPAEKKTAFTPETPTYEFHPEEFGVWHPYLNVSIPIDYLATNTLPRSSKGQKISRQRTQSKLSHKQMALNFHISFQLTNRSLLDSIRAPMVSRHPTQLNSDTRMERHYTPSIQDFTAGFQRVSMPKIPNPYNGSFSEAGYNKRPTFFGCDSDPKTPLIIYFPNYYMVGETNVATKETTYSKERMEEFFQNGLAIATQTSGYIKSDEDWPACLACALIDHQILRNSQARTKQCQRCFDTHCARV
ncbi:hypothetical protein H4Q26_002476 [Puccinia striiformis f. sp. tritici PST-130]|nr:hypothetical protein H4Q26_002476 [Puccinia striiformis f. sp. tritici PST-130]